MQKPENIDNPTNLLRFKAACKRLLKVCLYIGLILFISLSFYAKFIGSLILSFMVSMLIYLIGSHVAARRWMPELLTKTIIKNDDFQEHRRPPVNIESSIRQDWYNDVTNPMSPVYKAFEDSHRH